MGEEGEKERERHEKREINNGERLCFSVFPFHPFVTEKKRRESYLDETEKQRRERAIARDFLPLDGRRGRRRRE